MRRLRLRPDHPASRGSLKPTSLFSGITPAPQPITAPLGPACIHITKSSPIPSLSPGGRLPYLVFQGAVLPLRLLADDHQVQVVVPCFIAR